MRNLLSYIVLSAACLQANAQDVSNSMNVFIPPGVEINTNGSWVSSGFIMNNGSITLSGDWLNSFIYQGTGAVNLNGSDQNLNNNRQSIYKLAIGGGGIKTLAGSLMVDHRLTLTNGIVVVSHQDTIRLRPGATIEGGSTISYVDGAMIAYGTGYKFFPVGKNGKYHPVELLNVSGIAPAIEVEVQENLPSVESSIPATPITDIYWTQKVIQGSYEGSPVTVSYSVRDGIDADCLVLLEGLSFTEQFTARETRFQQTDNLDRIESRNSITGSIIALAELIREPPRQYYFSTTLSPNASNPENRTIKIFGDITTKDFRFQVFNRWGLVVYETSSADTMITQGWDGRQHGNMLPTGIYPYSLTYVDPSGKPVKRSGVISIIQ